MCDEAVWTHQQANLSALAEINIPKLRGFDSLTEMAKSVLEQAPEQFAVAGHSMGGRVALEVFNLAPDRVCKLALLDSGTHPLAEGERRTRQAYIDLARANGIDAVADEWIIAMVHPNRNDDSDLLNAIRTMIKRTSVEDFIKQIQALLNRPDASGYLSEIQCETLLLVGSDDGWSPVEQHEIMRNEIANSNLVVIEDAGHMSTMEKPEAVTNALRHWLMI